MMQTSSMLMQQAAVCWSDVPLMALAHVNHVVLEQCLTLHCQHCLLSRMRAPQLYVPMPDAASCFKLWVFCVDVDL
jgi:hypothetical protein